MRERVKGSESRLRLQALAEFRHQLRRFMQFSEAAAQKAELQPQQHQLLLQVAGAPDGALTTVGYVAERLGLRHNSVVELSGRCEEAGLLARNQDPPDRRCVVLQVTPKGREVLELLAIDHARELNELAPRLLRTLKTLETSRLRADLERKPEVGGAKRARKAAPRREL